MSEGIALLHLTVYHRSEGAPTIRQDSEAREVMQATSPTVIVQFQQDEFCNKLKYPTWYA